MSFTRIPPDPVYNRAQDHPPEHDPPTTLVDGFIALLLAVYLECGLVEVSST